MSPFLFLSLSLRPHHTTSISVSLSHSFLLQPLKLSDLSFLSLSLSLSLSKNTLLPRFSIHKRCFQRKTTHQLLQPNNNPNPSFSFIHPIHT
ncbi:hypothetical protein RIF29_07393 [Crotalaria pallida]|uniref:Uncharacterized protein n=1 Tax=Crotalaria pallida TaxID=3830 RepID=A0AAN9J441_CROPI